MPSVNYFDLVQKACYSRTPTYLVFSVTDRCNSNCGICFYHKNINRGRKELSVEEIDAFSKKFGPLLSLVLSGGEPFMRDDLAGICQVFYRNNNVRAINISTNGFFSEKIEKTVEEILENCTKMILSVEISIDDLGEEHDRARRLPHSFEKIIDTYTRLTELKKKYPNLWVKANTVFCSYNQTRMGNIRQGIKEGFNFDDHSITLIGGDPRDPGTKEKVSIEKYKKIIREYEEERAARKKTMIERLFSVLRTEVLGEILRSIKEKKARFTCAALKKIVFIDEVGDVYPCVLIRDSLGSLRENDYDIRKIIRSRTARDIVAKYRIYAGCYCQWDCGIFNSIIYDPRSYFRIIKRLLIGR
jgi:molybdenum cofactor biosynthesis enzyme MoaA